MKKIKISERDKMALYVILAGLILVISYFLVFTKLQEKSDELKTQNQQLQTEVDTLKAKEARKAEVIAETNTMQNDTQDILAKYPSRCNTEDAIYELNKLEAKYYDGFRIKDEAFTMNQILASDGTVTALGDNTQNAAPAATPAPSASADASASAAPNPEDSQSQENGEQSMLNNMAAGSYLATKSDISVSTKLTETALFKINDYINKNKNRMNISQISITKEDGNKWLNCSMVISLYAIYGNEKKYKEPDLNYLKSGKNSLFGK